MGTSTGITPYHAMLPTLSTLIQTQQTSVVILQGARTREDILYHERFGIFAQNHPDFVTYHACLSQEKKALQPFEREGYIQAQLRELKLNPSEDIVYLCGNPSMIDDAFEQLQQLGLSTQHIIREKYVSK